jgi:S1-C subfamily serine protease
MAPSSSGSNLNRRREGGFLVGDIITTWGDQPVGSVGEVAGRLVGGTVGQTAKLGALRGGNALELDVTIGERPRG